MPAVKRTNTSFIPQLMVLILCLVAWFVSAAGADDAKTDTAPARPAGKAATESGKEGAEPKKEAAEPAKEDPKARLLAMFKKEESITNTLGMVMVWVPKGHRVGRYEVTQREFEQIMKTNPSKFKGDYLPVESVTWEEAAEFCKKLTGKEQAEGKLPKTFSYALPTEGQWEYFVDEATLKDAITSRLGDRRNTENVGGLGPNKFGLYDVRGNVWEWCSSPVARGGSWRTFEDWLAVSFRYAAAPGTRYDDIGFRCLLIEQ
ncbi:MAG: hypothetical protein DME19_13990 [Verrucomicrobia bacterium]|nr:MAG: hypothetical protein DME19_13990 [Verrucomicrobiota bacterium]